MEETLEMSNKELDRVHIIRKSIDNEISQSKAAELLHLKSDRQIRNLIAKYKRYGPKGLISKKRGKTSNRAFDLGLKKQVMALVRERYPDFGPTFACEKLDEYHDLRISNETLRKWMIEEKLWVPRQKSSHIYPLRLRRDCFGEMIQIDGSHHLWFEERAEKCVLIVFIDDATSKITSLFFCPAETLEGYFTALRNHILRYGRPRSLYSDRHAIFGGADRFHHAQFIRAVRELDIESILARSPQAKGRVEKVNRTLQDRLVKEMRLRNISTIEDANRYLPEFIEAFNKKFSKEPRGQFDAHRPLASGYDLERTLTRREIRTLSKDVSFSFHNKYYIITQPAMINRLKNKRIEISQAFNGVFRVFYEGKELNYKPLTEYVDGQEPLNKLIWNHVRGGHPRVDHPWKKYAYQMALEKKIRQMELMV